MTLVLRLTYRRRHREVAGDDFFKLLYCLSFFYETPGRSKNELFATSHLYLDSPLFDCRRVVETKGKKEMSEMSEYMEYCCSTTHR